MRWLLMVVWLSACGGQGSVDWDAVDADVVAAAPGAVVDYFAEDNELTIQVEEGTAVAEAERIACDVAVPAVERAGGDPGGVTISVFEEGAEETLFDAADC